MRPYNWPELVQYPNDVLEDSPYHTRSCFFCGEYGSANIVMGMDVAGDIVAQQSANLKTHVIATVMRNLHAYMRDQQTALKISPENQSVGCCLECSSWIKNRTRKHDVMLTPVACLWYHLQTIKPIKSFKSLDSRVIKRLCATLSRDVGGKRNYYQTLFTASELETIRTLSTTTIADIPCTIAACYHARNLHTPLFNPHYPKLATLVRRATKRKLDALHDGVEPVGE